MQRILLQEKLSKPNDGSLERQLASNLRLIQLVEMGASTNKYRKSKAGGKLTMKSIAEELNFPKALVSLRHEAVHENRSGGMLCPGVTRHGLRLVQEYLMANYWEPVFYQLQKRESLLVQAYAQIGDYRVHKHKMPVLSEIKDDQQRQKTVAKLVKANVKLPKKIDPDQLA